MAFRRFWAKYATFSGRASRSEYWWWVLVATITNLIILMLSTFGGAGVRDSSGAMTGLNGLGIVMVVVSLLWGLATIVPTIALSVRRLHDANLSGFWLLLDFAFFVGVVAVFVMTLLPANPRGVRFDRGR